jgi:Lon protease-like protein
MNLNKVAVLPIPNLVFFPGTSLPLYVVEPVFIRMIKECVEGNMLVGISMAEPLVYIFGHKRPVPKNICGIGKPIILEEMFDGTLKVLIKGFGKVRLGAIEQNLPYLIYNCEEYPDIKDTYGLVCDSKVERLKELLDNWVVGTISDSVERKNFQDKVNSASEVMDYISMFLIKDHEMRQLLLENTSLNERIQMLDTLFKGTPPYFEDITVTRAIKSFEILEKTAKVGH